MSLKYSCPHCGQEIITQFLKPGEPCLCDKCRKYSPVPESAIHAETAPQTPVSPSPPVYNQPARHPVSAGGELADRGSRLGAAIIDGIIIVPLYFFFVFGAIMSGDSTELFGVLTFFLIILALGIAAVQIYFLTTRGQTLGKMAIGIKIVKFDTGHNGGFVPNVLLRSIVNGLIGSIPFIGFLYALGDILLIFAEDRRCIHDHLAGTVVVKVKKPEFVDPAQKMSLQQQV